MMLRDALPFARDPHAVCLCREDLAHVPARTGHIVSYPSRWYHHWRPSSWLGCDVTSPSSTQPARVAAARKPRERRETATIYHKRTRPGARRASMLRTGPGRPRVRPVRRRCAPECNAPAAGPASRYCGSAVPLWRGIAPGLDAASAADYPVGHSGSGGTECRVQAAGCGRALTPLERGGLRSSRTAGQRRLRPSGVTSLGRAKHSY